MFKLIALYKTPENVDAFESHYKEVHMPICRKIPGIKEVRLNRVFGGPMGKSPFYLQAELCWESKEAFTEGVKSPASMESGKDIMNFAKGLVDVFFVEESVERL
jgi:uncharacterized protein (TIGR02118 family)